MGITEIGLKLCSIVTLGPKGQIVIPKEIRDAVNLKQGDNMVMFLKAGKFIGLIKNIKR